MLTLYTGKGTSGIAAHILLEEVGADYEVAWLSLPDGDHRTPDYLAVNPKARVPTLITPEGPLSENVAILTWIGQAHPQAGVLPESAYDLARMQALNTYIASTVHVAFAHLLRGARWSDDPAAHESMKARVPGNLRECAALIEAHYLGEPWAMGARYTAADPYLLLVARWLMMNKVPLDETPGIKAHTDRLMARPATTRVLAAHGLSGPV